MANLVESAKVTVDAYQGFMVWRVKINGVVILWKLRPDTDLDDIKLSHFSKALRLRANSIQQMY